MSNRIFALLVGINDYSPTVGKLTGCVNDVDHFHDYLTDNFDQNQLRIEVLKDADATRANIVEQFRSHLCQATANDVVIFQYCGHGARWKSAKPFEEFYPDGKDEGLVCYDSRQPGGFDLADKELAVLLAELAKNDPHIAVILDCCHSGSATRGADDFTQRKARQTDEVAEERPLESYLDGHYAKLLKSGKSLEIPGSRHILLSACQRAQKAWEGRDHSGVFTSSLLEALERTDSDITYADLFTRCRAMVRKRADNQDPQFETYRTFNAYSGFLGRRSSHTARRFSAYFEGDIWNIDCGALHGLPSDPDRSVEFALYPESDRSQLAGHAISTQIGAQKSEIALSDFESASSIRYQAELTSLPLPPLAIHLTGNDEGVSIFQQYLDDTQDHSFNSAFTTDDADGARFKLSAEDDCYLLTACETGKLIQGARGYSKASAGYMFSVLKLIDASARAGKLQNHATKMNPNDVDFKFVELIGDDQEHPYPSDQITLDIRRENGAWSEVSGKLIADNRSGQPLHLMLVHLSEDFGIQTLYNERVEPTDKDVTFTPMGENTVNFLLEDTDGDESTHVFKLIVSTEKVDDFLLGQDPLEIGGIFDPRGNRGMRELTFGKSRKKLVHENEWFTKDLHVKLVRQLDHVSVDDATLANGTIVVKGHPFLQANISLTAAKSASRSVGGSSDIYRVLERQGMELLNFSGTRGDNASILELTNIQNAESLEENPLEIELDLALKADEYVLPLVFDGEHILVTGETCQNEAGRTQVSINQIPEVPDGRRNLGKALKLYFFKTFLKRANFNRLCWVEYGSDNAVQRHRTGVAEKVASASNVLVLIHGIIGDTEGIAEGLRLATTPDGKTVDEQFDLVLTYDYENLSTPIAETAEHLKQQLQDVGLDVHDDKQLTLLVHSMGGLVARWFIEQSGGNQVVDHLVMFGTPNNGSPFGKVGEARKISSVLTTLAINTMPVFAPYGAALLSALSRTQKVTPTLEQMNSSSEFIKTLNASPDPSVRYTIVAGDVRDYQEESGKLVAGLIAKLGRGFLFDTIYQDSGHDIAVSDESIRGIADSRIPPPTKVDAICHHLNYFVSDAALKVLVNIKW